MRIRIFTWSQSIPFQNVYDEGEIVTLSWRNLAHECIHAGAQSCSALCNPMDCSPPGSSVHGTFQARILEWVTISYSRISSWPRGWTRVFHIGRQILYYGATWEFLIMGQIYIMRLLMCCTEDTTMLMCVAKSLSQESSLVVQWLRIHLSMQETQVRFPVREDSTCHGETKPVYHNYWGCVINPGGYSY